jgi:hypothetical protein
MKASLLSQVAEISNLDLAGLRARWRELVGTDPPAYSRVFLAKRLACRLQELAFGGVSEDTQVRMRAALGDDGMDGDGRTDHRRSRNGPVAGTRLVREWNGQRCEVTVVQGGYEYEGRRYQSLSSIARAITGTRWNGPAFFGLRKGRTA